MAQRTAGIAKPNVDERAIVTKVTSEVTKNKADRQNNTIIFKSTESKSNLKAKVMTHDVIRVKQLCLATAGKEVSFSCKRLGKKTLSWQTSEGDNRPSASAGHGDNNDDVNNGTQNPKPIQAMAPSGTIYWTRRKSCGNEKPVQVGRWWSAGLYKHISCAPLPPAPTPVTTLQRPAPNPPAHPPPTPTPNPPAHPPPTPPPTAEKELTQRVNTETTEPDQAQHQEEEAPQTKRL